MTDRGPKMRSCTSMRTALRLCESRPHPTRNRTRNQVLSDDGNRLPIAGQWLVDPSKNLLNRRRRMNELMRDFEA
jgi:hypothetical protein